MTAKEAAQLIGTQRTFTVNGLKFDVIVTDVKQTYGRTRYEITPLAGFGSQWVETLGPASFRVQADVDNRPHRQRIESGN